MAEPTSPECNPTRRRSEVASPANQTENGPPDPDGNGFADDDDSDTSSDHGFESHGIAEKFRTNGAHPNDAAFQRIKQLESHLIELYEVVDRLAENLAKSMQSSSPTQPEQCETSQPRSPTQPPPQRPPPPTEPQGQSQAQEQSSCRPNHYPDQNYFHDGSHPLNRPAFPMPFESWFSPNAGRQPYVPPGFGAWKLPSGFSPPYDPRAPQAFNPHPGEQHQRDARFTPSHEQFGNGSPRDTDLHGREPAGARNPYYQSYGYGYAPPHPSAYPYAQPMAYPGALGMNRMGFMSGLGIGILGSSISSLALLCLLI